MEEYNIDNEFIAKSRSKINSIEDNIDSNKKILSNIDNTKDIFICINDEFEKCYDLLRKSMKSESLEHNIENYTEMNNHNLNNTLYSLDEKKENVYREIKNLYAEKEAVEKEIKDKYREEYDDKQQDIAEMRKEESDEELKRYDENHREINNEGGSMYDENHREIDRSNYDKFVPNN